MSPQVVKVNALRLESTVQKRNVLEIEYLTKSYLASRINPSKSLMPKSSHGLKEMSKLFIWTQVIIKVAQFSGQSIFLLQ